MAHLLDLTPKATSARITDESKLSTVKLMTPQQLYELWERQPWSAHAIDFEQDKADWAALDEETSARHRLVAVARSSSARSA